MVNERMVSDGNSSSSSHGPEQETRPEIDAVQEYRFAVVMYGGVSLAIYINGITRELLELVRSTAAVSTGTAMGDGHVAALSSAQLSDSGRVYRKIGQLLGSELALRPEPPSSREIGPECAITSRFVIDILSGTSAGGINAVFLAKALANNQKIDKLKDLWVKEGEIDTLINDRQSLNVGGVRLMPNPDSLLNSQRMYLLLLDALDGMDPGPDSTKGSGMATETPAAEFVDELDLFITTTDIRGRAIPIQLKDMKVDERKHRHVFHLRYTQSESHQSNDFSQDNNPFLAFVARCTSSFPLAFEPMTLQDSLDLLKLKGRDVSRKIDDWIGRISKEDNQYHGGERAGEKEQETALNQAFGDGGYLDNKPFSYATETLLRRRANLPIKRNLIYIEPTPEQEEKNEGKAHKPDAIENCLAALINLPRYETIREDIERIINRNRIITRINRITTDSKIDNDVRAFRPVLTTHDTNMRTFSKVEKPTIQKGDEWKTRGLDSLIKEHGISYGTYHRLKVESVTDDLAKVVTQASGHNSDNESAEFLAIRLLLRIWRDERYQESPDKNEQKKKAQAEFLMDFDVDYRLRRLFFVRRKVNELARLKPSAKTILENLRNPDPKQRKRAGSLNERELKELRKALGTIRINLTSVADSLLAMQNSLGRAPSDQDEKELIDFREKIHTLNIRKDQLRCILNSYVEAEETGGFESFLSNPKVQSIKDAKEKPLRELAESLGDILKGSFSKAHEQCEGFLPQNPEQPKTLEQLAQRYARDYFDAYEHYDMAIFPILYGTDVGESEEVDIIRISPLDAKELKPASGSKLAGTSFNAFGGFLKSEWRENDILWGRLDGAERLITALLPGERYKSLRSELIREAHQGILHEELGEDREKQLLGRLLEKASSLQPADRSKEIEAAIRILEKRLRKDLDAKLTCQRFMDNYRFDSEAEPEKLLKVISRLSEVFGEMLHRIASRQNSNSPLAPLFIRVGRTAWGLVEIATPKPSMLSISVRKYWLPLIFLFGGVLIVLGFLFSNQEMQTLGFKTLGITAAISVCTMLLGDVLRRSPRPRRLLIGLLAAVVIPLLLVGIHHLPGALEWLKETLRQMDGCGMQIPFLCPQPVPRTVLSLISR